jgi:hypothetical protein
MNVVYVQARARAHAHTHTHTRTIIIWLYSPNRALASPIWGFVTITFYRAGLLVQRPTPNLEDQVSVFMTHGDRVAQLYPQALGTHFSRLLRHAWFTVGLFFNPGHHTGARTRAYYLLKNVFAPWC